MKKITAIVFIVLVTLLTFTGCDFELEEVREFFSEEEKLVLITEKSTNVDEETQSEEGTEITESTDQCFFATDVNEKTYQILWENADEVPENSVVIITYYEFQNEKVSIRVDDVVGIATCRISAVSLEYADDDLAVKTVLEKEYGRTDLSSFRLEEETVDKGMGYIYRLYFGEFESDMYYRVTVGDKAQIISHKWMGKEYRKYMDCVSDESIALAEERLAAYDSSRPYLTIDREGYLCLCVETIVDIEPPTEEDMSGCGIDHEHVFHTERISDEAHIVYD